MDTVLVRQVSGFRCRSEAVVSQRSQLTGNARPAASGETTQDCEERSHRNKKAHLGEVDFSFTALDRGVSCLRQSHHKAQDSVMDWSWIGSCLEDD